MEQSKLMYRILKVLADSMDNDEFAIELLSPDNLSCSKNMRDLILKMLLEEGYIKGVECKQYINQRVPIIAINNIQITLKGIQFLEENSLMKKMSNMAKGIVEIIK